MSNVERLITGALRRAELEKPRAAGDPGDVAPAFSEDALALAFADKHAERMRYVAAWSRWLIYNGTRWEFDETLRARGYARQICRAAATAIADDKERLSLNLTGARPDAASLAYDCVRHTAGRNDECACRTRPHTVGECRRQSPNDRNDKISNNPRHARADA